MNSRRLLRNRHTWVDRNWETKRSRRTAHLPKTMPIPLHDFCLTIPFGFLIGFGGLMGFLSAGSVASLASGGGVGGLLCWLGFQSLAEFKRAQDGGAKYECAKYCNACLLLCLPPRRWKPRTRCTPPPDQDSDVHTPSATSSRILRQKIL